MPHEAFLPVKGKNKGIFQQYCVFCLPLLLLFVRWVQHFTVGPQEISGVVGIKGINAKAKINLTYEQVIGAKSNGDVIELKTEDVTCVLYAKNASERAVI